jgi:hypothetical protein
VEFELDRYVVAFQPAGGPEQAAFVGGTGYHFDRIRQTFNDLPQRDGTEPLHGYAAKWVPVDVRYDPQDASRFTIANLTRSSAQPHMFAVEGLNTAIWSIVGVAAMIFIWRFGFVPLWLGYLGATEGQWSHIKEKSRRLLTIATIAAVLAMLPAGLAVGLHLAPDLSSRTIRETHAATTSAPAPGGVRSAERARSRLRRAVQIHRSDLL